MDSDRFIFLRVCAGVVRKDTYKLKFARDYYVSLQEMFAEAIEEDPDYYVRLQEMRCKDYSHVMASEFCVVKRYNRYKKRKKWKKEIDREALRVG